MKNGLRMLGLGLGVLLGASWGCGDDEQGPSCTPGHEGCSCSEGKCLEGLTCASKVCVSLSNGGASNGGASNGGASNGGTPSTGGASAGGASGGATGQGGTTGDVDASVDGGAGGDDAGAGGAPSSGGGVTGGAAGTLDAGGDAGDAGSVRVTVDACTAQQLAAFASPVGAANMAFVYPYDGTVFPRGLAPPLLMWAQPGGATTAVVEIRSRRVSYRRCQAVPDGIRAQIPREDWESIEAASNGPDDLATLTLTTAGSGTAYGPISRKIEFATAALPGSVLYQSYGVQSDDMGVKRVVLGATTATTYLQDVGMQPVGPCRTCHSVSANGTAMAAAHYTLPGVFGAELYQTSGSGPTLLEGGAPFVAFGALTPDGSKVLASGAPNDSTSAFFPTAPGNVGFALKSESLLLDARTGAVIASSNWGVPHAQMPMFSPDGARVAYNDHDNGEGHSLRIADANLGTNTFANRRQVFTDATRFPGWPSFTPDGKKVMFALGTRSDFVTQMPDVLGPPQMTPTGRSHLVVVDVATGAAKKADLANGNRDGSSYLPAGAARDNELDFFPMMSPVAAGGYYWVFFTSRRTYGNMTTSLGLEDPSTKKIWVAAIDPAAPAGADPSRPAFLLPGQDLTARNFRPVHVPAW